MNDDKLARAYAAIDAINAEDPATELVDGAPQPKELVYGRRMTAVLERLEPSASDALRIAVRGQHLGRFRVPRSGHPEGRVGYLEWRIGLGRMHADLSAEAARAAGYDDATIERVRFLVQKKALRTDPETQLLEDCACLVFLEHHFAEFAARTDEAKMIDILKKTWGKMSDRAHAEALSLSLGERELALVKKALT
ncbi:MAG: DUF4202 domain-containing protein [Deltaproteobacteria bacterium]|nr:DUF4202 domain-containing protein [Deltaproteobacteria bacterium]